MMMFFEMNVVCEKGWNRFLIVAGLFTAEIALKLFQNQRIKRNDCKN